jgi:hypothetical protein
MINTAKVILSISLFITLFINRINLPSHKTNLFAVIGTFLFILASKIDIMLGLLVISLIYVVFTKIDNEESFFQEKRKIERTPAGKSQEETTTGNFEENREKLCNNINFDKDFDEDFLIEYETNKKKLEDVQNNVFDKYNNEVFYNELGENSMDIQGIHNHEVPGYELNDSKR